MNNQIIKILVLKDWSRMGYILSAYGLLIIVALIVYALPWNVARYLGAVSIMSILIGASSHVLMTTTVLEHKELNAPFIYSLPVAPAEYVFAKMVANLGYFLLLWFAVLAVLAFYVFVTSWIEPGFFILSLLVVVQIFVNFVLVLTVALWTQNEGWTTLSLVIASVALNPFIMGITTSAAFSQNVHQSVVVWNNQWLIILAIQFVMLVIFLLANVWRFSHKKVFI